MCTQGSSRASKTLARLPCSPLPLLQQAEKGKCAASTQLAANPARLLLARMDCVKGWGGVPGTSGQTEMTGESWGARLGSVVSPAGSSLLSGLGDRGL